MGMFIDLFLVFVSLCSSGWQYTHCITQTGLGFRVILLPSPLRPGGQPCASVPGIVSILHNTSISLIYVVIVLFHCNNSSPIEVEAFLSQSLELLLVPGLPITIV